MRLISCAVKQSDRSADRPSRGEERRRKRKCDAIQFPAPEYPNLALKHYFKGGVVNAWGWGVVLDTLKVVEAPLLQMNRIRDCEKQAGPVRKRGRG